MMFIKVRAIRTTDCLGKVQIWDHETSRPTDPGIYNLQFATTRGRRPILY